MTLQITAVKGNIVQQIDCDAIVNSANANLRAGSGVCGAIYRAAGPELEPSSVKLAPLGLGQAVSTPGFNLPNRLIIHCRGPRYLFDPEPAHNLALSLKNTILLAETHKVNRLAVPAISMGVYAYPSEEAVPILIDTAHQLRPQLRHLEEIRFVLAQDGILRQFQASLRQNSIYMLE